MNSDGTINISFLGEAISEPFRLYCKNQLKDETALGVIKEGIQ